MANPNGARSGAQQASPPEGPAWIPHPRGQSAAAETVSDEERLARAVELLTGVVERIGRSLSGREGVGDLSARIEEVRALLREPESDSDAPATTAPRLVPRVEPRTTADAQPDSEQVEEHRPYRGERGGQSHV